MRPGTSPPRRQCTATAPRRVARGVVCFTPRHDLTLARLPEPEVLDLLRVLQAQYRELGARDDVRHVLVFENKGEIVGVSNPHPHCQIYATNFVFKTIETEAEAQAAYFQEHRRPMLPDILSAEEADARRLLVRRGAAVSFIPYFARYPYETYVAPRATHSSLADLPDSELADFAAVLRETLIRFDNLWRMSFPYVMVLHQAPTDGVSHPGFHFHIQIHPPLRKPGLLKYLAGPEIGGGNFLNDAAPEDTAAELRATPAVHYAAGA
jgi:UDPglucose--hexose-1-phosphate uridylyltransferase